MNVLQPAAFAATLHDPEGGLSQLLSGVAQRLGEYSSVHVIATAATNVSLVEELRACGAQVRANGGE